MEYNAENRPVTFSRTEGSVTTRVTCTYDFMGRRATKKVETNGETTLHQRYLYRGYLQIACCDQTRANHPCLWLITWDPTQTIVTRPLVIQKSGIWYCYGWELTKNICEVFGSNGYINTTYTPYGEVTSSGSTTQPLQWSSEFSDAELGLSYYNYRHYNPADGRWLERDRMNQNTGDNTYSYVANYSTALFDILGNETIKHENQNYGIGGFGAGHEIHINTKSYIRLGDEAFYLEFKKYSQGRITNSNKKPHPKKGKLWITSKNNPGKLYHLDVADSSTKAPHHNVYGDIEKIRGLNYTNHSINGAKFMGDTIVIFKYLGRACFFVGSAASAYSIYHAEDRQREIVRQVGGWVGASIGAAAGAKAGAAVGAVAGSLVAGAGAAPGAVGGGFVGGLVGGFIGWWAGSSITETVYDWYLTPLEKEEYIVCGVH